MPSLPPELGEGGKIKIDIDASRLCVTIRDNGPGQTYEEAVRALLPIAQSQKHRESDRGFRGIGRLAGTCFLRLRHFSDPNPERSTGHPHRCGMALGFARRINGAKQTEHVIRECVTIEKLAELKHPTHFFEVQIVGIARHAAGLLLNRQAVRKYIGEVCPVPFASSFPFASRIEYLLTRGRETAGSEGHLRR